MFSYDPFFIIRDLVVAVRCYTICGGYEQNNTNLLRNVKQRFYEDKFTFQNFKSFFNKKKNKTFPSWCEKVSEIARTPPISVQTFITSIYIDFAMLPYIGHMKFSNTWDQRVA